LNKGLHWLILEFCFLKLQFTCFAKHKVSACTIEDAVADVAATAFCTTVASFRNTKEPSLPFWGKVVVAIVVATARCARVATSTQPHFLEDNTPAIEVIQMAISILLFRSAVSPLRMESVTIMMLSIIQATIAYITGGFGFLLEPLVFLKVTYLVS
jgi:hypothetical protein